MEYGTPVSRERVRGPMPSSWTDNRCRHRGMHIHVDKLADPVRQHRAAFANEGHRGNACSPPRPQSPVACSRHAVWHGKRRWLMLSALVLS